MRAIGQLDVRLATDAELQPAAIPGPGHVRGLARRQPFPAVARLAVPGLRPEAVPASLRGRPMYTHNPEFTLVRTLPDEMARLVLDHWGVRSTADIGDVVFTLVDLGLLISQPTDSRLDFADVFGFDQAFERDYPWRRAGQA